MESEQQHKKKKGKDAVIDFPRLWAALKRRKTTYFKVIPTVILTVWIISLGIPDYYKCTVQLSPEESIKTGSGALSMLASSFGLNISGSQGGDAITVMLYPDLLNSVDFKTKLFNIKVKRPEDKEPMTYYEYLRDEQYEPWWLSARKGLFKLIFGEKEIDHYSRSV